MLVMSSSLILGNLDCQWMIGVQMSLQKLLNSLGLGIILVVMASLIFALGLQQQFSDQQVQSKAHHDFVNTSYDLSDAVQQLSSLSQEFILFASHDSLGRYDKQVKTVRELLVDIKQYAAAEHLSRDQVIDLERQVNQVIAHLNQLVLQAQNSPSRSLELIKQDANNQLYQQLSLSLAQLRKKEQQEWLMAQESGQQQQLLLFWGLVIFSIALLALMIWLRNWIQAHLFDPLQQLIESLQDTDIVDALESSSKVHSDLDELAPLIERHHALLQTMNESFLELSQETKKAFANEKAKSQFLANMSHEILTPLNGVVGLNELVLGMELESTPRRYVKLSLQAAKSLQSVISDVLDFARIDANSLTLVEQRFSLEQLLVQVMNGFYYQANHKSIDMHLSIPPELSGMFLGDTLRLRQVLINVMSNAIKFTDNGDINIAIDAKSRDDNDILLHFAITDTGSGIAESKLEQMLNVFNAHDDGGEVDADVLGLGLGLTISSKLVELMGGRMWATSTLGEGSCFQFTVRLKSVAHLELNEISHGTRHKHFLVVTQNPFEREALISMIESWDSVHEVFPRIIDTLNFVSRYNVDYAIIDLHKSIISDYYDLLAAQRRSIDPIKFIVYTDLHQEQLVSKKLRDLGLKDVAVISKPATVSKIYEAILGLEQNPELLSIDELNDGDSEIQISKNLEDRKVLVVEDNEINQLVIEEQLKSLGFDVTLATNGKEAVMFARNNHFDAIFMDLQMPIMDGYEATSLIREFDKEVKVIALSAAVQESDRERAKAAGVNDHIPKPATKGDLVRVLEQELRDMTPIDDSLT